MSRGGTITRPPSFSTRGSSLRVGADGLDDHVLQHGGRQVHADDAVAFIVILKELPGIVEPEPRRHLSVFVLQLNLRPVGLIAGRASIEKNTVAAYCSGHD